MVISFIDMETCKVVNQLQFEERILILDYSPAGNLLVCCGTEKSLILFDLRNTDEKSKLPQIVIENDDATTGLSFSPCERYLAQATPTKVKVFQFSDKFENENNIHLLHIFKWKLENLRKIFQTNVSQLLPNTLRFSYHASSLGKTCMLGVVTKDSIFRLWEVGSIVDPFPYEIDPENFIEHYMSHKPYLINRQDYGPNFTIRGNTIVHRLVIECDLKMLIKHLSDVQDIVPVENDHGQTPLDLALKLSDYDKTKFLIQIYTKRGILVFSFLALSCLYSKPY